MPLRSATKFEKYSKKVHPAVAFLGVRGGSYARMLRWLAECGEPLRLNVWVRGCVLKIVEHPNRWKEI